MRSPIPSLLLAVALVLAVSGPALASPFEVRLGSDVVVDDTGRMADEAAPARLSLGAGLRLTDALTAGLRARFAVGPGDEDSAPFRFDSHATLAGAVPVGPVALVGLAGLGWYTEQIRGSDWVFDDHGGTAIVEAGVRFPTGSWFSPEVVASWTVSHSQHHDRNTSWPEWTHAAMLGVGLVLTP